MKIYLRIILAGVFLCAAMAARGGLFDRLNDALGAAKGIAKEVPSAPPPSSTPKPETKDTSTNTQPDQEGSATPDNANASPGAEPATASLSAYQNYDFVPGDAVIFFDDFSNTQDGEFPDQWDLKSGQGVVNKIEGESALLLTDGNYAVVVPNVKNKSYLGDVYTVELDTYDNGGYSPMVFFENGKGEEAYVHVDAGSVEYKGPDVSLGASLPAAISNDKYHRHWHHIAIAVKNSQLKVYVDQYRVLTVPKMHIAAANIQVKGIGDQQKPIVVTNFRIASGGGMNLLGHKFTDAKIITHGINFDIDKATIRPESMGTLNQIKSVLTGNPDLKFEIDGYTDNSGTAAHNLELSQKRADAVLKQLVNMGIDSSRLTAKGMGDSKPISSNDTAEGRANNRRVEFVRT